MEAIALNRVLSDSSDESESEEEWEDPRFLVQLTATRYLHRSAVSKICKWDPERIFRLDPTRSRRELRISVQTFTYVLELVSNHAVFARAQGKQKQAPIQLQLEFFLWSLQSLSYHNTAQHFGIGEGYVRKFSDRVVVALLSFESTFIRWPDMHERQVIKEHVECVTGFKNCIGFIDGIVFKLRYAPPVKPECYFSRKSDYCFNAQIVCDHLRRIIYYQLGIPGSVHDKRALSFAIISHNPDHFFAPGEFLFGDSAYGVCFSFLVSLYKRPATTTRENARFNHRLARARIAIEHCQGMIKARSPILSTYGCYLGVGGATERVSNTQRACFLLHKISINMREEPFETRDDSSIDDEEDDETEDTNTPLDYKAES